MQTTFVFVCIHGLVCIAAIVYGGITSTRVRIPANIDLVLSLPATRPMKIEFPRLLFETSFSERFIVAFISLRAQEVNLVRSMGSKRFFLLYANGLSMTVSSVFGAIVSVQAFLERTNYFSDTFRHMQLSVFLFFFALYKRYAFRKRGLSIQRRNLDPFIVSVSCFIVQSWTRMPFLASTLLFYIKTFKVLFACSHMIYIYMFFSFHKSIPKLTYSKLEHFFLLQTTFNDLTGNLTIYRTLPSIIWQIAVRLARKVQ